MERYSERVILDILGLKEGKSQEGIFVYAQEFNDSCKNVRSKNGGKGKGKPEFLVTFDDYPNTFVVVECKAKASQQDEAIKDIKHYMREMYHIDPRAKVFGIAFSGSDESEYELFFNNKSEILSITKKHLSIKEIIDEYIDDKYREITDDINSSLIQLNKEFHSMSITGWDRSRFLAAIIGASTISGFYERVYLEKDTKRVLEVIKNDTEHFFSTRGLNQNRINSFMAQITASLDTLSNVDYQKIISVIKVWEDTRISLDSATRNSKGIDILGRIFNEFLRYTGSDKKGKGQVLTPDHFAELFVKIADLSPNDTVIDITCGTGAFLVHSLTEMLSKAKTEKQRNRIRENSVWGNDNDSNMTLMAMLNLVLHGDGVSNIRHGDALYNPASAANDTFKEWINNKVPKGADYALINPPYYLADAIPPEPIFIERAADLLKTNGVVVAIHPISVLLGSKYSNERRHLFKKHTLLATMIAPQELFEAGVVTAISVWKAKKPHRDSDYVWFADWSNEVIVKYKKNHRIDKNNTWKIIRDKWVDDFRNKREIPGYSVYVKNIRHDDEWTLYPHVKTDYSNITFDDIEKVIRDYISYTVKTGNE